MRSIRSNSDEFRYLLRYRGGVGFNANKYDSGRQNNITSNGKAESKAAQQKIVFCIRSRSSDAQCID